MGGLHGGVSRRAAAALAGLALVSACTGGNSSGSTDKTIPRTSVPTAERFEVEQKPLWASSKSSEPTLLGGPGYVKFLGDSLLLQDAAGNLGVVDPATGKPRWTLTSAGRRAKFEVFVANEPVPVVRDGKGWAVITSYASGRGTSRTEHGVSALEVANGRVRWTAPMPEHLARQPSVSGPKPATSDGAVAVNTIVTDLRPHKVTTWAIDVADRSSLWDAKGMWPQFVAGGAVLGSTSEYPPEVHQEDDRPYVTALDAQSGKKRWDVKGRYDESRLKLVAGDVALISALSGSSGNSTGADKYEAVVIDAGTGKELAKLGEIFGSELNCASDGRSLIACTVLSDEGQGERLATFDVARRELHLSPTHEDPAARWSWTVQGVWDGYVFVNDSSAGPKEEFRAVDRDGNVVSGELPGRVVGMSDKYAVFTDLVDGPGVAYAVYRVAEPG